jgi:raffinose/stachyose/melibiose transport system permease protein
MRRQNLEVAVPGRSQYQPMPELAIGTSGPGDLAAGEEPRPAPGPQQPRAGASGQPSRGVSGQPRRRRRRPARFGPGAMLGLAALTSIVPFISIVLTSLQQPNSPVEGFSWPSHPDWGNFAAAWTQGGFADLLRSSAVIAFVVTPVGVVCATMAGFAFGTMTFRAKRAILALLLVGLTLPYESIVIALYYGLRTIGLLNTYWALILPLTGAFMPFGTIWMRAHFSAMPRSVIEAAEVDGASSWTTFWRVMFPTARPALSSPALLYFMWSWNQFLFALILIQSPSLRTAPAGLSLFVTQFTTNVPLLSASTIIVIAPIVAVYIFFHRQLSCGLLQGIH